MPSNAESTALVSTEICCMESQELLIETSRNCAVTVMEGIRWMLLVHSFHNFKI